MPDRLLCIYQQHESLQSGSRIFVPQKSTNSDITGWCNWISILITNSTPNISFPLVIDVCFKINSKNLRWALFCVWGGEIKAYHALPSLSQNSEGELFWVTSSGRFLSFPWRNFCELTPALLNLFSVLRVEMASNSLWHSKGWLMKVFLFTHYGSWSSPGHFDNGSKELVILKYQL